MIDDSKPWCYIDYDDASSCTGTPFGDPGASDDGQTYDFCKPGQQGTGPVSYAITATNAAGTSAPFTVKIAVFEATYPGATQIEATCAQTVESLVGTHFLKLGTFSSKTYYVNCPTGCDAGKLRADVYGRGGHGCLDNG